MTPNQRKHFKYVRDVMHGEAQQKKESVFCEYCGGNDDAEFGLPTDHCTDCARPQSSTQTEALKLALEALETGLCYAENEDFDNKQKFRGYEHLMPTDAAESIQEIKTAIAAIKEALAQPASYKQSTTCGEPVAFGIKGGLAHETKVKND